MTSPRRGEVWLIDLGMAAKVWPALVISIPTDDAEDPKHAENHLSSANMRAVFGETAESQEHADGGFNQTQNTENGRRRDGDGRSAARVRAANRARRSCHGLL